MAGSHGLLDPTGLSTGCMAEVGFGGLLELTGLSTGAEPAAGGLLSLADPTGLSIGIDLPCGYAGLLDPTGMPSGAPFPTQYDGLRAYYGGAVHDLCLVAFADAPTGMGAVYPIDKNGTTLALYLVEVTDPNASPIRIPTTTGTKAIRLKT